MSKAASYPILGPDSLELPEPPPPHCPLPPHVICLEGRSGLPSSSASACPGFDWQLLRISFINTIVLLSSFDDFNWPYGLKSVGWRYVLQVTKFHVLTRLTSVRQLLGLSTGN
jgi:hypothetical protein